jgi:1,4-dihydroxy-2-naphthoate polyprenyltransferase
MKALKSWIMAARPKTLTVSAIPIVVGTTLALACKGAVRPDLSILAFLSTLCIQIGTNFINDAIDFKKGADTAERIGPVRVTQSGLINAQKVWWAGIFFFALAMGFGIPLVISGGPVIVAIGLLSLVAGYAYTGGPLPLAYLGLGDLFVLIFFGWVAVGGIYYLNTGEFDLRPWVAGTQIGLLATVLIAINNLRDHLTDRKCQKKTLAVRLGPNLAKLEIGLLAVIPFIMGFYWLDSGMVLAAILPLLIFPFAIQLFRQVYLHPPGAIYNQFLAKGAMLQLGFGFLQSLGFYLHG